VIPAWALHGLICIKKSPRSAAGAPISLQVIYLLEVNKHPVINKLQTSMSVECLLTRPESVTSFRAVNHWRKRRLPVGIKQHNIVLRERSENKMLQSGGVRPHSHNRL